jgi:GDPmannose 4,6-dehydratase
VTGVDAATGRVVVRIDPRHFRPTEFDVLQANPAKAREVLGWTHTVSFSELVREMVASDLKDARDQAARPRQPQDKQSFPFA